MCPFCLQKITYWRSNCPFSNELVRNKFERTEDMNKEIQLLSDEKIREMGKRIKDKRKEKGFKAIDFADIIGIGKDQISRIENGKLPCKTEYLYIMSQVLEVSVDYLMFGNRGDIGDEFAILVSNIPISLREKAKKILGILAEA